jgi:hypothetical protein
VRSVAGRAAWNPWRALRDRGHLILRWAHLPRGVDGTLADNGDGTRTLSIEARLGRIDRNAVLAHELVHDERSILYFSHTPMALIAKEEALVEAEVARRLVPLDDLEAAVVLWIEIDEPVTATLVAEAFEVPANVAERALRQLVQRHRSPAHAVWRARA